MIKRTDTFKAFDTIIQIALVYDEDSPVAQGCDAHNTTHATAHGTARAATHDTPCTTAAFEEVRAFCQKCENALSRTIPTSDISRINKSAGKKTAVSETTAHLIERALPYCEKSRDVFDITIGSVTPLWDFKQGVKPSAAQIGEALEHVSWKFVHVFHETGQAYVRLESPRCALDLGGIAKGWIADEISALLLGAGFPNHLINLGGNVLAHGKNERDKPWTVQVDNPFDNPDEAILVHTTGASLVTSGTYQRCFMKNGTLFHHILNPQTGYPVESDAVSATIMCEKSLDAEGFSTTALALGVREGLAFCAEQPEILAAFFIDINGRVHAYEAP